jgi:nitroreductase
MKILEVGRLAPTAKNLQSQRILAVTSPEGLEKVYKAYHCFSAPVVLVICGDKDAACDAPTTERNMAATDATIVATHMMLETYEQGLGCTYVCAFKTAILKEELALPENVEPYALLPIGYPADDCVPSERHSQRFPLEHTVKFI